MEMASPSRFRPTREALERSRNRDLWVHERPSEQGLVGREGGVAVGMRGDGRVVYVTVGEEGGVTHTATPKTGDAERGQHGAHEGRRGLGRQWWQWRWTPSGT